MTETNYIKKLNWWYFVRTVIAFSFAGTGIALFANSDNKIIFIILGFVFAGIGVSIVLMEIKDE